MPGGTRHSSARSSREMPITASSIDSKSARASPLRPTSPGDTSHSSPRAASSRTTTSAGHMAFPDEHIGDAADALEVVHADLAIRDRPARGALGPRDELEDADRVDDARAEEWRLRV